MAEPLIGEARADAARADAGIPGFPGPFPVGRYALRLRERVREFAGVAVIGEVTGARLGRGPNVYFELRDPDGALPCVMWRDDFERLGLGADDLRDGAAVVAAGGLEYYPGSATASPRLAFRARELRRAGEGDLLARLARLRRQLASEGLFEPQKRLRRKLLPRCVGVVTSEGGAARRDFVAALERRGWGGRIVWAFAPVQDRRAAPAIATQIRELAALGGVDAIVVTRGGGSIADLWAFCDETLCRTVALTPVPVISAVGHDVDRTLLDDVAAVCCSTPTHAAEAAVGLDCSVARGRLRAVAQGIEAASRDGVLVRARSLALLSRAPAEHVERHRRGLHQAARELRAAARRGRAARIDYQRRIAAVVLDRRRAATATAASAARDELCRRGRALTAVGVAARAESLARQTELLDRARAGLVARRSEALRARTAELAAHDPERTLERGYALVVGADGEPLATTGELRSAHRFDVRLADGAVGARVDEDPG